MDHDRALLLIVALVAQAEPFGEQQIDLDGGEGSSRPWGSRDLEVDFGAVERRFAVSLGVGRAGLG